MQEQLTSKSPESASRLTRRSFLGGSAAVAVVTVPATLDAQEADDNYERLMWAIDLHRKLVAHHSHAVRAFDRIDRARDRPQASPRIEVNAFFEPAHRQKYYPGHSMTVLRIDLDRPNVHDFFDREIESAINRANLDFECAEWPAIKAADYHRVLSALSAQRQARQVWEVDSGYLAAKAEADRLLDAVRAAEKEIVALPVRSFRDLQLKLDLVASEHWVMDEDHLRLIMASIVEFAATNSRPTGRRERVAVAGAV